MTYPLHCYTVDVLISCSGHLQLLDLRSATVGVEDDTLTHIRLSRPVVMELHFMFFLPFTPAIAALPVSPDVAPSIRSSPEVRPSLLGEVKEVSYYACAQGIAQRADRAAAMLGP